MRKLFLLLPLWFIMAVIQPSFAGFSGPTTSQQPANSFVQPEKKVSKQGEAPKTIKNKMPKMGQIFGNSINKIVNKIHKAMVTGANKWLVLWIVFLIASIAFAIIPGVGAWLSYLFGVAALIFFIVWLLNIVGIII